MHDSARGRLDSQRTDAGAPSRHDAPRASAPAVHKGWHSRGYLPHLDAGDVVQMVTFRLADSFPQEVLALWADELAHLSKDEAATERHRRIERYIIAAPGSAGYVISA